MTQQSVHSVLGRPGGGCGWKVRKLGFLEIWRSLHVPSTPTPTPTLIPTLNTNHGTRIISNCVPEPREELLVVQDHLKSDKDRVRPSSSLAAFSLLLPQGRRSKPFTLVESWIPTPPLNSPYPHPNLPSTSLGS